MGKHRLDYVSLSEVQRWPRNPKLHDEKGLDDSLERHGFVAPLILDETSGKLVAGHGRLEALLRRRAAGKAPPTRIVTKGMEWMVPVVRGLAFRDAKEAEVYLLADNRITEGGGWDEEALLPMLERLLVAEGDSGIAGTGFNMTEIDEMMRRAALPPGALDAASSEALAVAGTTFQMNLIKQVVMKYDNATFDSTVAKLTAIGTELNLPSSTQVVEALLKGFEESVHAS